MKDKFQTFTRLTLLGMLVLGQSSQIALSAPAGAVPSGATIQSLEMRLFEHPYAREDESSRIARLEKFVFGKVQSGSNSERLTQLQSAINRVPAQVTEFGSGSASASGSDKTAVKAPAGGTAAAPKQPQVASSAFEYGNYPRVTELEKHLLNETHTNDSLNQRLSRLETRLFGKPSSSTDLCARVDALDNYAARNDIYHERVNPDYVSPIAEDISSKSDFNFGHYGNAWKGSSSSRYFPPVSISAKEVAAADAAAGDVTSARSSSNSNLDLDSDDSDKPANPFVSGVAGTEPRLAALEKFCFGHNFAARPMNDRLERLEKRLVPYQHNLAQNDTPTRVDHLWSILSVANTLNSSPIASGNRNSTVANVPSGAKSIPFFDQFTKPTTVAELPFSNGHQSWLHNLSKTTTVTD